MKKPKLVMRKGKNALEINTSLYAKISNNDSKCFDENSPLDPISQSGSRPLIQDSD